MADLGRIDGALIEEGLPDEPIVEIIGGNALRVLKEKLP